MLLLLVLALTLGGSHGMIHDLVLVEDSRPSFLIESFGFSKGGFQRIETTELLTAKGSTPNLGKFCFIIKVSLPVR